MEQVSLFDDLIRPDKASDIETAKQSKAKKNTPIARGGSISSKIAYVREFVEKHLGKYRDSYITITTEMQLDFYIRACVEAKCVSIDTETTGLDPMLDKIVGVCLYYPDGNGAYIPLRHKSYITGELLEGQLSPELVAKYLVKLADIEEDEMFNAKFDTRFIKNDLGVKLHCTWDGYLAGRIMNENEPSKGLKALHSKYVLNGEEDEFSFGEIFKGISIEFIPIDIATVYGAHDAVITHELIEFQKQYLYYEPECSFEDRNGMNGASWCFFNIEMPLVDVLCELEDTGILLDTEYAHKLSVEYNEKKAQALEKFSNLIEQYQPDIDKYNKMAIEFNRNIGNREQKRMPILDAPVNISSPQQLSVLFYDVLGYEVVDTKSPRGTGEEILQKWDTDLTRAILDYRGIDKLIGTYIDKLPACANPNDGRIHASFNQYGADTGRMSSDRPNLQNIPSHNKDIRKMFVASRGEELVDDIDNSFLVDMWSEVCTTTGWKYADTVKVGDCLVVDDDGLSNEIIVRKINTVVDKNQIVFYY